MLLGETMATQNTIGVGVNISDNGTAKKTIKNVEELHSTIKKTQATADKGVNVGGTAGSRGAAAAAFRPSGAAVAAGPTPTAQVAQYGSMRGSAGATGAAGRDFANQAQGLGGLVRLYATLAANMFAAGAAFNALSSAMDTSNMIKGLDQLGAGSGIALGSLSKRLASATDNAISLREAMAATVKASSSGMNSDQILRMGQVAKQASIALGVDMSDAISRISRGITKLEPELLDELGLFTKTGKAAEDYAKSVGKSVAELTDFERRQAFANAVLAEGEKKFGEIDAKANSYTVLLASIKDASFTALNALNTVLGPVITLLSQSPGALIAGMVGLATIVLKQAIPALGQLRENLESVAKAAASDSYDKAAKAQSVMTKALTLELQQIEQSADAKLAVVEKSEAELAKAKFTGLKTSVEVEKLLNSTVQELREEDFAAASEVARKKEEDAKRWSQSASKSWQTRGIAAQEEANITRQLVKEVREHKVAEEALTAAKQKAEKTVRSGAGAWTVLGQNLRLAEAANTQSVKKSIVSNAAYNASLIGLRGAAVLLKNEIDNSGLALTRMGTAALYARGGIAILTGAIATLGATITKALNVIGILVTVFSLLDSFAGNKKVSNAMKELSDSIDIANSSSKTFTDTMTASYKGNMLAVTSLEAQSTALNEVSLSLTKATDASIKAQKTLAQGTWYDKTIEFFKDLAGFGIGDKFQETLSESITSAVEGLSNSSEGDKVKRKFADIFKIDPKSVKFEQQLKDKIKALDLAPDSEQAKNSIAFLTELGIRAGIATSRAREFKDALNESVTSSKALADVYKVTNPITTFVETSLTSLKKLDLNLQEPKVEAFAENLLELSKELSNDPIFGPQQSAYLSSYSKQLQQLNTELTDSKKQLKDLQDLGTPGSNVDKAQLKLNLVGATKNTDKPLTLFEAEKVATEMISTMNSAYNATVSNLQGVVKSSESGLRSIGAKFKDSIESGAKYNLDLLITQLQQTLAEGSTKFIQGILSSLSSKGIIGAADLEKTLKLQELDAQRASVTTMRDLIAAMKVNSATVDKASATAEKAAANKAYYELPASANTTDRSKAVSRVVSANVDYDQATKQYELVTKAVKNPIAALNDLKNSFGVVGEAVRSNVMAIAQSMAGFTVQLQKFNTEEEQIILDSQVKSVQEYYTAQQEILNNRKQVLDVDTKALQLSAQNKSLTDSQIASQEDTLKIKAVQLSYDENISKAAKEYAESSVLIDALETKALANQNKKSLALVASAKVTRDTAYTNAVINAEKLMGVDIDKTSADSRAKTLQKELSEISKRYEMTQALAQLENTKNDVNIEQATKELELYSEAYGLSQSYVITQRTALEQEAARLSLTFAINQAEQAMEKRRQEAEAQKKALGSTASTEALRLIDEETVRQQALSNIALAGLSLQYNNKVAILSKTQEINLEQERYNELLNSSNDFANNLKAGFEDAAESSQKIAAALGNVATTMAQVAVNADKRAKSEKLAQDNVDKAWETMDYGKVAAAEKEQADLKKKNVKQELSDNIKTVGAAKGMFKEKTAAYKVLAATEKAMHLYRMAITAKDIIADGLAVLSGWFKTEQKVQQAQVQAAADAAPAGAAAAKDTPGPVWVKIAAGLAAFAFVMSLSKGGKGGNASFTPSSEQRQETQGTAMSYNSEGALVQTSRGVFGDTEAKSESIANSLERIKETSVDGLRYDTRMVDLLSSIDDGINNTAKGLYSVLGLRKGTRFGTVEGESKSGGILGFFGTKTTANITDSGILINATFNELANGIETGSLQFYEDVTKTKKKFLGKTKSWNERNLETADASIQEYFNSIFTNATDLFLEIGEDAKVSADSILTGLSTVNFSNFSISTRGLKGEELEKELSSVIGSMLDQASQAIFSQFTIFEEFGEDLTETVIRVVDGDKKAKQALSNININTLANTVGMVSFVITDALIQAADGLENFLEKAEYYRENFLTEAEQLAPIQKEVAAEMFRIAKLGFTSADGLVDTRKEFKALVSSLDLTTENGQEAYTALMNVAEGFHTVTEVTEEALQSTIDKFKKFSEDLKAFRDNLILGSSSILTPLQKYAEAKLQFESTYTKALAGDEAAQGKLTSSAQTFLTASKDYFASSSAYTQDFNSVLDKVGSGISGAEEQISIAEMQLNGITTQIGLLTTINENIAVIAGVPKMATGGLGRGLTMVGELGPELVDFRNPGRVYTADQTQGMFAPQTSMTGSFSQVVNELRQVKQEISKLRQDQQQQTGDLIVSNYDANAKAAEAVTTEVSNATIMKEWQQRNRAVVV